MSHDNTSLSLLDRVAVGPDSESWRRLLAIYTPLLQHWLQRYQLQPSDVDDLVQEVLSVVARELPKFQHDGRPGVFRGWLKRILVHRLRDFWRAKNRRPQAKGKSDFLEELAQLEDPASSLSQIWNQEHDQHVLRRLFDASQTKFTAQTWNAFRRLVFDGVPAAAVAAEMGVSVNAVLIAKSRVLCHLKQEARGMVD